MGRPHGQLFPLLFSGLLSQRVEAWPPALLVEGRPRFLGPQSIANGMDLLAVLNSPFSQNLLHPEAEQRAQPLSPCMAATLDLLSSLVLHLPSPAKAMPVEYSPAHFVCPLTPHLL